MKKFKQYGTKLIELNYRPVLLILRQDNLTQAINACQGGGWLIKSGQDTYQYIYDLTKFDLKKGKIPEGLIVDYLPPYSPELQPAERLWTLVDEPLVNEYFETIDDLEEILVKRCNILSEMKEEIRNLTYYHWLKFP